MKYPWRPEEDTVYPEAQVKGGSELSIVGAEN